MIGSNKPVCTCIYILYILGINSSDYDAAVNKLSGLKYLEFKTNILNYEYIL
jgi:hypothetical protein